MKRTSLAINATAIVGALLSMVVLVGITSRMVEPDAPTGDPLAQGRAEKLKALRESNLKELTQLETLDEKTQTLRLPVDRALDVMLKEWQSAEEGRQWLKARYDRKKGDLAPMQALTNGEPLPSDTSASDSGTEIVDFFGESFDSSSDGSAFDDLESFDSFDTDTTESDNKDAVDFEGSVDDAFGDF